jgi:homotetrameric cytidine deaminase
MMIALRDWEQALIGAAMAARREAWAPYSHFLVGAAVRVVDETPRIFVGCNVECSSYGLTSCAERNAVAAAVVGGAAGRGKSPVIDAVAVVADVDVGTTLSPCGACRQVLYEFMRADGVVLVHNIRDGSTARYFIASLLPVAFDAFEV